MVLAASLFALDLPRVWVTSPGGITIRWNPSVVAVVLVALQTLPIAVRRVAPIPVLVVTTAAVVAYVPLSGQPEPDYLSVLIVLYTVASAVPQRAAVLWCGAVAAVLVPFTVAQERTVLAVFRGEVLVVVVSALGLDRRRAIHDRAQAAEKQAERDARTRALRAAQREVQRRDRIARNLHDVLARSLATIVAQGEALRRAPSPEAPARIDGLVRSGREALAAARGAVAALDHDHPTERPSDWAGLLAAFTDVGLIIETDPKLLEIPLDGEPGQCLYRVVHEGLTNALRHAGPACTVRIDVETSTSGTTVRLTNDRIDRTAGSVAAPGYGLLSLQQDVVALSGTLDHRNVKGGWQLEARLPLTPETHFNSDVTNAANRRIPLVIVDDQNMIREGLRLLLQDHADVEVIAELANGRDLLDFLGLASENRDPGKTPLPATPNQPDTLVVLLDLVMPDLDGLDVLAILRRHPTSRRPRTLVLTTYDDETKIRGALALGADGFILKDSTARQLITAIRSVAGGLTALSPAARDIGFTGDPATTAGRPVPPRATSGLDVPPPQAQARQPLTPREAEVLELLGQGLSNRAIAKQLDVAERTVKIHVSKVLSKLNVESRTQAALLARR